MQAPLFYWGAGMMVGMNEASRESWELAYELTEDDLVALTRRASTRNVKWWIKRWLFLAWLGFPIYMVLKLLDSWMQAFPAYPGSRHAQIGLVAWLGLIVIDAISQLMSVRGNVRRMLRKGHSHSCLGWTRLVACAESLRLANHFSDETNSWSCVWRIRVTATHVFFHEHPLMAYIIPRRAFESDEAFQAFIADVTLWRGRGKPYGAICPKCGYDLRGHEQPGCPECGWERKPPVVEETPST
jgi:hypothetical protein